MLFSTMTFVFVFLPILLVLYFSFPRECRNLLLLLASIIFYVWGDPSYLPIIFLVIFISYFGAIIIDKLKKYKKEVFIITIILDLSVLIYFKYFNFIVENISNIIFHTSLNLVDIVMPIGISFYTFQAISYVADVYKGECNVQKNIYNFALYICLFPQLIAGPIIKYHDIEKQITSREINFELVTSGVKRFIVGLSKKILIANTMGLIADKIFSQNPTDFQQYIAWFGAIAYSLQLYFDFSGYSDMAIGLGLIFGFKFAENFNYPYISRTITEFWRRWHISLSTWFKQYVYIPLGGNKMNKYITLRNLGIVFLLTGIWHGAAWNFVVWGIWHGFFIILEKGLNIKSFEEKHNTPYIKILQHAICLLIIIIGWVIFRADNMKYAFEYLMNMFGIFKATSDNFRYSFAFYANKTEIIIFIIAIICCTPIFKKMTEVKNKYLMIIVNLWLLILFFFCTVKMANETYNPFIYFRF